MVGGVRRRTADAPRPRRAHAGWRRSRRTSSSATPGPTRMFDDRLYKRGALTLHALRLTRRRRGVLRPPADLDRAVPARDGEHRAVRRVRVGGLGAVGRAAGRGLGVPGGAARSSVPPAEVHLRDPHVDRSAEPARRGRPEAAGGRVEVLQLPGSAGSDPRSQAVRGSTSRPRPAALSTASLRTQVRRRAASSTGSGLPGRPGRRRRTRRTRGPARVRRRRRPRRRVVVATTTVPRPAGSGGTGSVTSWAPRARPRSGRP